MRPESERGSAGLWVVAVAMVLVTVTVGVLAWSGALVARQRAQSAADLAALAAARHAGHAGPAGWDGDSCAAAERVARAAGAGLVRCAVGSAADVLVEVEVEVAVPGVSGLGMPPARARARAGPSG